MLNVTTAITQAIRRRVGWKRIAVAISVVIAASAAITLFRLLRDIELSKVIAALKAQSMANILASIGFTIAGYAMLTCYDLFGLRVIGWSRVPYRVAAFASFTSYTIGHNFGATILTSGVVRYRIYSGWGLSAIDIAKIAFITGLTYWLGTTLVLGCGFSYAPDAAGAINHLPASINRLIGLLALAGVGVYLFWLALRPRVLGRANWRIDLPRPTSTLLQISIGALDLIFVTSAMYVLLPQYPLIDLVHLTVVFITAMLLGVVSYAPGGLGVLEAAMFIALPQFQKENLLVSLLTFRVLYFVLPLLLAVFLLGLREFKIIVGDAIRQARRNGCG